VEFLSPPSLKSGPYELVVSRLLKEQLANFGSHVETKRLDKGDSHAALADYLRQLIRPAFESLRPEKGVRNRFRTIGG
jgi:hypothetical protein